MHKRAIAHRDLKPQNILLGSSSLKELEIRVADFGLSCFFNPDEGLDLNVGSPIYMAPELVKKESYNEKVDIWSIGIITFNLLSGKMPFETFTEIKEQPLRFNYVDFPDISRDAIDFITKCLNRDVGKRHSARQMLQHPWLLKNCRPRVKSVNTKKLKQILQNLENFSQQNDLQKSISSIMVRLLTKDSDLKNLRSAFQWLDKDNNGQISTENIQEIMGEDGEDFFGLSADKWMQALTFIDEDYQGNIDFHEFFVAAVDHKKVFSKVNIEKAFKIIDVD